MLVIDANVIKGHFQEAYLCIAHGLSASTVPLFSRLGRSFRANVDDKGIIAHEWRQVVAPEWFDAWYGTLLIEDKVIVMTAARCPMLLKRLRAAGFPQSRDAWYVRTAAAVVARDGKAMIITEDVHFFDPAVKGCGSAERAHVLRQGIGPVRKLLLREGIEVAAVCNCKVAPGDAAHDVCTP